MQDSPARLTHIRIPFPPSMNRLWRYTAGRAIKSATYRSWLAEAAVIVRRQKVNRVTGPFRVCFWFNPPDKRSRDLDNCLKATFDLLEALRLIEGDHLCNEIIARWDRVGAQADPGTAAIAIYKAIDAH